MINVSDPDIVYRKIANQTNGDEHSTSKADTAMEKDGTDTAGRTCPNCGAKCIAESLFCSVCGKKLEQSEQEKPAPNLCPYCKEILKKDAEFCHKCGSKL